MYWHRSYMHIYREMKIENILLKSEISRSLSCDCDRGRIGMRGMRKSDICLGLWIWAMKYLYSGTSAIGVPKMAKERTGVAQPGTRWLRAWMVGAEAQAVPMTNLSALMTFRLGPKQFYGMRCLWDLGRCYDEECWDWPRFDGYFGTRTSSEGRDKRDHV